MISDPGAGGRRWAYAVMIAAAGGILLSAIHNVRPLLGANDRSRWCTVWSLVERGTFVIDEIEARPGWGTIDKVRHNGHFYSSKPPLLSTLYAGVYWAIRATTGWTLDDNLDEATRSLLVVAHLVPWLVALWVVCLIAERYVRTDTARLLVVGTAAFGTLITTFSVTLNNHSMGAVSATFAIYSALRVLDAGSVQSAIRNSKSAIVWAALAGFFAAFTSACESPAALLGLGLFVFVLRAAPRAAFFAFLPAAAVPLAAYFGTNWLATGSLRPFQAAYGSELYEYVHEGVPSYWKDPKGLDRNVDSPAVYFLHCTVGHHGIFTLTPMWLLSLGGWLSLRKRDDSPLRPLLWMGLVLFVAVLGFYMTRTQNYNYGGNSAGLRWVIWLTPLLLVAIVPVAEQWGSCWRFRTFAWLLLAASAFSAHSRLGNPWTQPWLFGLMRNAGYLTQYDPEPPPAFDRPQTTWFPSIPEPTSDGRPVWVEFSGVDPDGRGVIWRLSAEDTGAGDSMSTARVRFSETTAGLPAIERELHIDRASFDAGEPPSRFLRWPDGPPDDVTRERAESLLRGLPADSPYRAGVIRYLKFPVRATAFRCQGAAAWVVHAPSDGTRALAHRTDVWRCDDVPFGVMQIETAISDASSRTILSQRRMTIRAHSKMQSVSQRR